MGERECERGWGLCVGAIAQLPLTNGTSRTLRHSAANGPAGRLGRYDAIQFASARRSQLIPRQSSVVALEQAQANHRPLLT